MAESKLPIEDLYRINDWLTSRFAERGQQPSDEALNEATHQVGAAIERVLTPPTLPASSWGEPYDAVSRVVERELAMPDCVLSAEEAASPAVRFLALQAYKQGQADEREKWEPPF